jgi:hypothetical protein
MCCAEPDCNAPNPQLDTLTKTGPTITQALLQQDSSFDVATIKRVYKPTILDAPTADGEVVPLPRILHTSNGNGGVVYMPMVGPASAAGDANDQANSMLEYQLLQSGVMPMGAEGYGAGSYGGYGADGTYGGAASSATSATDTSAGTLEEGQYTYTAKPSTSSGVVKPQASVAAVGGSSASAKTSGAAVVRSSLSVVAVMAVVAAGLALQ